MGVTGLGVFGNIVKLPKQCFHCRVPGGFSRGPTGVKQGRPGSAFALSCCKTHTIVTPTPKKLKRNCTFFVFAVKHNEFGAFSVQDALEAPMAAPAPREFPRELPESLRKPPRCLLPDVSSKMPPSREQKKHCLGSRARFI